MDNRAHLGGRNAVRLARPGRGRHRNAEVVVVGAGLAGLAAAHSLVESGLDSVLVLEARGRVGGRTLNRPIGSGRTVEVGGQWIGPTQTEFLALADRLGVRTFPTYDLGDTVYYFDGARATGRLPPLPRADLLDFDEATVRLDRMALEIPLDRPWRALEAADFDALTLEEWLRENTTTVGARELYAGIVYGALGQHPARVSLLWFLFYVHSAGGVEALIATRGGAQESRVVGGSQIISHRLATELDGRIVLRSPVRCIAQRGGDRILVNSRLVRVLSRRVIVAMMPADMRRISFRPGLPPERRYLIRNWPAEPGLKANLCYDTPFWRHAGLNGQALTEDYFTYDNSPPDGSRGVLVVFADSSRLPRQRRLRRQTIARDMAVLFGDDARLPDRYVEMDWGKEKWNAGCVSPLAPGLLTMAGRALRQPVGNIHWAGTETSDVWNGYMEGAVRSGKRVAGEVLATL